MQILDSLRDTGCFDIMQKMTKWVAIVTELEGGIPICHQFGGVSTFQVKFVGNVDFTPTFSGLPEICYGLETMGMNPLFVELEETATYWKETINELLPKGWRIRSDEGISLLTASWEALIRLQHLDGRQGWLIWDNSD